MAVPRLVEGDEHILDVDQAPTPAGYRIDWIASREVWLADQERRFREAHGLADATLEVDLLRIVYEPYPTLTFRLTNRSEAKISFCGISVEGYGNDGRFLDVGLVTCAGMESGKSVIESTSMLHLKDKAEQLDHYKLTVKQIRAESGGTQHIDATSIFTVKDVDAGGLSP